MATVFLAAALAAASPAAHAVDIRIFGPEDDDTRAISNMIEQTFASLDIAQSDLEFEGPVVVSRRATPRSFIVRVPRSSNTFSTEPGSINVGMESLTVNVAARSPGLLDYTLNAFPTIAITRTQDWVTTVVSFEEVDVRSTWDNELGLIVDTDAKIGRALVRTTDGLLTLHLNGLAIEGSASSGDGRAVDHTGEVRLDGIRFELDGNVSRVGATETTSSGSGVPIEVYRGRFEQAMEPLTAPAVSRAIRQMRDPTSRTQSTYRVREIALALPNSGSLRIERLSGDSNYHQTIVQAFDAMGIAYLPDPGSTGVSVRIASARGESLIEFNADDALDVEQTVRFDGFETDSAFARFFPTDGAMTFGVEAFPLAELAGHLAALQETIRDTGEPPAPGLAFAPFIAALSQSGTRVYFGPLDLDGGAAGAEVGTRFVYDLASRRLASTPNQLVLRGLNAFMTALSSSANANMQVLGMLRVAAAMGRLEMQDDETVHVYEFSNGPNGGILLNGRPLGAPAPQQ